MCPLRGACITLEKPSFRINLTEEIQRLVKSARNSLDLRPMIIQDLFSTVYQRIEKYGVANK